MTIYPIRHVTDLLSVSLVLSFRSCDGSGRNVTCFSSIITIVVLSIEKWHAPQGWNLLFCKGTSSRVLSGVPIQCHASKTSPIPEFVSHEILTIYLGYGQRFNNIKRCLLSHPLPLSSIVNPPFVLPGVYATPQTPPFPKLLVVPDLKVTPGPFSGLSERVAGSPSRVNYCAIVRTC